MNKPQKLEIRQSLISNLKKKELKPKAEEILGVVLYWSFELKFYVDQVLLL